MFQQSKGKVEELTDGDACEEEKKDGEEEYGAEYGDEAYSEYEEESYYDEE